jgi:hypothetical protein
MTRAGRVNFREEERDVLGTVSLQGRGRGVVVHGDLAHRKTTECSEVRGTNAAYLRYRHLPDET